MASSGAAQVAWRHASAQRRARSGAAAWRLDLPPAPGRRLHRPDSHAGLVAGRRWLACAEGFRLRVLDVESGEARCTTSFKQWSIDCGLAFSPDGATIAWSREGEVALVDARSGELRATQPLDAEGGPAVAFSPDGALLTGAAARRGAAVEASVEALRRTLEAEAGEGQHEVAAVSPDGSALLVATTFPDDGHDDGPPGIARLFRLPSGVPGPTLIDEHFHFINATFARDGSAVACAINASRAINQEVRVFCARTGELRARFPGGGAQWARELRFSPDGRFLAAVMVCDSNVAWLCAWDLRTGLCDLRRAPPDALENSADPLG